MSDIFTNAGALVNKPPKILMASPAGNNLIVFGPMPPFTSGMNAKLPSIQTVDIMMYAGTKKTSEFICTYARARRIVSIRPSASVASACGHVKRRLGQRPPYHLFPPGLQHRREAGLRVERQG